MTNRNRIPSTREKILGGVLAAFLGAQALVGCAGASHNTAPASQGVTGPQAVAAQDQLHAAIVAGKPVTYESGILTCQTYNKGPAVSIESPLVYNYAGQTLVGDIVVDHSAQNGFRVELFSPSNPQSEVGNTAPACTLVGDGADPTEKPGTMHSAVIQLEGAVDGGYVTGTNPANGAVIDRSADNHPLHIAESFEK